MKKGTISWILIVSICALIGVVAWVRYGGNNDRGDDTTRDKPSRVSSPGHSSSGGVRSVDESVTAPVPAENGSLDNEGKQGREGEEFVDAFDSLTDKWMEPSKDGVTMRDVDAFVAQFRKVPKARKEECLQRALNLVPDENIMLLAGILMDKTQDKELIATVYNDILNRDESVKKPILQQIFKDKDHPCWTDTAWILDVTGELPEKK